MSDRINYLEITEDIELSDGEISDINVLLEQLSAKKIFCSRAWIEEVARSEVFVVAMSGAQIVGMATLCLVKNLSAGKLGYIHEVVVHTDFRRRGIMSALMEMLHCRAKDHELDAIELTSDLGNEDRRKAIAGYLKMGYRQKDTGVFVYKF
ncbi:MAG: GNAT family N-acetyltransferase [Candidatus Sungbacteria bacterium]|nr:GNAT family N-acetyltransferase [Candidatus Sungbacteria bacterium]